MNRICKFSILRYVPNEIRQEFINIGIVLHSPSDQYVSIKITDKFNRVKAFDDELDISLLKLILEGVKDDFSKTELYSGPSFHELSNEMFLEKQTFSYSNQIQFSPVHSIGITLTNEVDYDEVFDNYLNDLFKTYVYYDLPRNQRITSEEVNRIMSNVFKSHETQYHSDMEVRINDMPAPLDFIVQADNKIKIIKTFSFDFTPRKKSTAFTQARIWAWNFQKLKKGNLISEALQSSMGLSKKFDFEFSTVVYVKGEKETYQGALSTLGEESLLFTAMKTEDIAEVASLICK